jgi:FkbM family methyltransferase
MNFTPFSIKNDLWGYLCATDKKIVMYGMGNGADKILAVCEKYGIEVCDFFASDGFVRGHSFHGKRVLSYSEVKEKYGMENIIVLLSFASSLPDVIANIKRIGEECELYAPDVPVCGNELFTLEFAKAHSEELQKVYELLEDEPSKRIYTNVIFYKLTGDIKYLFDAESDKAEVYTSLLNAQSITSYADLGAYNGDTVRELMQYAKDLSTVSAFEPDRRSFRKLCEWCDTADIAFKINKVNAAAWSCETTLTFGDEGNRNSGIFAKGKAVEVAATSLDIYLNGEGVDYIKYDVEGCEKEAIEGSTRTILSHRPRLLVSAYHRSEDIFALPLQIKALRADYKLYLRRHPYIPAWDLNLICV